VTVTALNNLASPTAISPELDPSAEYAEDEAFEHPLLQQIWRVVWLNRFLVAGILAATLVAALVITLLATPQYTSTARVQVNRVEANVANVEGIEPEGQVLDYEEFYNTQYALLESSSLAERVARTLNLVGDEAFLEAFDISPDDEVISGSSRRAVQKVGEILLENVNIRPVIGSSLIDVEFTSPSPELSAKIAAAWVDEFIAASIERRFAASGDAREFLQQQLAALRERLEDSERQFVTYASNTGIFELRGSSSGAEPGSSQTLIGTNLA